MSFSKSVKEEIIKKNVFKKEIKSFLQGLFLSAGSLVISNKKLAFILSNENEDVIMCAKDKIERVFPGTEFNISKVVKSFKQKERFELSVASDESNLEILTYLGIISKDDDGSYEIFEVADKSFMKSTDSMTAFLIGAFLGTGSISVPSESTEKKSYGYHFEIVLSTKPQADIISEIFSNLDIFPKQIERNELYVVYLKNCDMICDTLVVLGASKSTLDILSKKSSREFNNTTNRQMNCFSANVDKTMTAAAKQMVAIDTIQKTIGIENLPENLQETALARIANPESSLKDLINVLDGKISKGALSQRFNKIIEIANELGENDAK